MTIGDDAGDRHGKAGLTSVMRGARSRVEDSKLLASRISPLIQVAEHPEDLVADVGLEAVDGQDHPAGRRRSPAGGVRVGAATGQEFIVTVQEIGDGAEAEGHVAAGEFGMDLGDAPALGMPQGPTRAMTSRPNSWSGRANRASASGRRGVGAAGAGMVVAAADVEPEPDPAAPGW